MTADKIDTFLGRTGSRHVTTTNRQRIFPEVGFTCDGILRQIVFGASRIQEQMDQRPELQIWRPVGDATYWLVNRFDLLLSSNSRGLQYYSPPSNISFKAGDVIGYNQPDRSLSQYTLALEGDSSEDLQCAYRTVVEKSSLFSTFHVEESDLNCDFSVLIHPITGMSSL